LSQKLSYCMKTLILIVVAACLTLLSIEAQAFLPLTGLLLRNIQLNKEQADAIKKVTVDVSSISKAPDDSKIMEIKVALLELEQRRTEMEGLSKQMGAEAEKIQKERDSLVNTKALLESREKLFSYGIFAALTTAIVALFTLIGRLPTVLLERQLLKLEIIEKTEILKKMQIDALPN
jgi:hypothetical protein